MRTKLYEAGASKAYLQVFVQFHLSVVYLRLGRCTNNQLIQMVDYLWKAHKHSSYECYTTSKVNYELDTANSY